MKVSELTDYEKDFIIEAIENRHEWIETWVDLENPPEDTPENKLELEEWKDYSYEAKKLTELKQKVRPV